MPDPRGKSGYVFFGKPVAPRKAKTEGDEGGYGGG